MENSNYQSLNSTSSLFIIDVFEKYSRAEKAILTTVFESYLQVFSTRIVEEANEVASPNKESVMGQEVTRKVNGDSCRL